MCRLTVPPRVGRDLWNQDTLVYVNAGFWDGDVSQLLYMWYYVVVLNMLVRNANLIGPMRFRCLMFSLSGPCELLLLLYCIASDPGCGE